MKIAVFIFHLKMLWCRIITSGKPLPRIPRSSRWSFMFMISIPGLGGGRYIPIFVTRARWHSSSHISQSTHYSLLKKILEPTYHLVVSFSIKLAGQITRRVAPSVAPSTGCSIIIIILFFRMNIVHWLHCINMAIHTRPNLGPDADDIKWTYQTIDRNTFQRMTWCWWYQMNVPDHWQEYLPEDDLMLMTSNERTRPLTGIPSRGRPDADDIKWTYQTIDRNTFQRTTWCW